MNQREKDAYERYTKSHMLSLYDAYGSFSKDKADAWKYCERLKEKKNGKGLKVIGKNGWFFSAGFTYEEDGKPMFMYITHGSDTPIVID